MKYLDHVMAQGQYSHQALQLGVKLGSEFIEEAGGWQNAARLCREETERRRGNHFAGLFDPLRDDLVPEGLLRYVRTVAKEGVRVR